MTTHELAKYLLEKTPDLPVVINGWGSNEGMDHEVDGAFITEAHVREKQEQVVGLGYFDIDGKTWCFIEPRL